MKIAAVLFFISAIGTGAGHQCVVDRAVPHRRRRRRRRGVGDRARLHRRDVPPRIRGRLGSLQQLAIVLGIFLSLASTGCWLTWRRRDNERPVAGLEAWRWMFLMMAPIPAVLYGFWPTPFRSHPLSWLPATAFRARKVLTMLLG